MSDYISRKDAINRINSICVTDDLHGMMIRKGIEKAVKVIYRLPAADVAPVRHGEWTERACRPTCSLCGFSGSLIDAPISPFKYCPNCGAKMGGDTP